MRERTGAIIIIIFMVAVFLVVLYEMGILDGLLGISNRAYISGVSLTINDARPISCFGNVVQPLPEFNISKGAAFYYTFNLTDSCQQSHNITNISVINSGFKTKVISPRLQYQIFQGNRVPFQVLITPPASFDGGVLDLQVNVT